ncbi:TonB-dependent receptor plug domain-containing protein [Spongiimicrobium sp. 3-5]|uniref:TonB-dependent receptor plug domain-containing protein n=1 Tax=Spongiimicrobium sp. 3-5 TaxID=3332596 RepID=UPI00397FAC4D
MNNKFLGYCATVLLCTSVAVQAQQNDSIPVEQLDEVVVSDSRFNLKRENSGKTVIKITAAELERNQGRSVAEIINVKSGLELAGSRGRPGTTLGVFARGGRGSQVLVIIDGVRISDPSSFSREYDLRLLLAANIASIEIIKGAASTLYGTNAATAVINITTKKASDKPIAANFQSSVGTNQTSEDQNYNLSDFSNSAQINGTLGSFTYLVGFSNTYTNGISALVTTTDEEDDYSNLSTDIKLGYKFSNALSVQVYGSQTKLRTQFDETFGFVDAPYQLTIEQNRVGVSSIYKYNQGSLNLNGAYTDYNSDNVSGFPSVFKANNVVLDVYNKYNFNDRFYTVLGLNYLNDKAEASAEQEFTIIDPYANVVYVSPFGLNINTGFRINNHSEYGSNLVYNVNPSFTFKMEDSYVKVLSSYATSYITPSLAQLFGDFGANPNLEPEDNRTIEGGVEYGHKTQLRLSALYFNRKEENFITFDENFMSINSENTIDAQGVEVELDWQPLNELRLSANYTYTERKGDNAIRIPKHKINSSLSYTISKRTNAAVNYSLTGDRLDTDFGTFTDIDLPSFSLVDLYFSHEIIPGTLKFFLSANNIFNESYTEVIGFSTKGRNIRGGININL